MTRNRIGVLGGLIVIAALTVWFAWPDSPRPSSQPSSTVSAPPSSATPSSPAVSPPARYLIANSACSAADFSRAGLGDPAGPPTTDHEDKTDLTAYTCDQRFARGTANMTALIFQSGESAAAYFTAAQTNTTSSVAVTGLGAAAYTYTPGGTRQLWVRDGNLVLGVRLKPADGSTSAAGWLNAAAEVARVALPRLSVHGG